MLELIKSNRILRDRVQALSDSIANSNVFRPKDISKFVFLCGANQQPQIISERRKALMSFAKSHLPHTQFFIAEKMFTTLLEEGHKGNVLDVENEISIFADYIVIVLESASAFAELGAFSHNTLRKKLIVINDAEFEHSDSFINNGPLKAIMEKSGGDAVMHYKMKPDGVSRLDAIGDIFDQLYNLLKNPIQGRSTSIKLDECDPSKNFNKISAMFIHDLIYFSGPIKHAELTELLKIIFGDSNFRVREHVAILGAFDSIMRNEKGLYKSQLGRTYFSYKFDINKLIATFRNCLMRDFPERIYGY